MKTYTKEQIKESVKKFVKQALLASGMQTKDYNGTYEGYLINVGFGQGSFSFVPGFVLLGNHQTPQQGIYPCLLLYRKYGINSDGTWISSENSTNCPLVVAYGVSATHEPQLGWGDTIKSKSKIGDFCADIKKKHYKDSFVEQVYSVSVDNIPIDDIFDSLNNVVESYKNIITDRGYVNDENIDDIKNLYPPINITPSIKINIDNLNLITALKENHNIILHGAPGTGKTYLAKEIAIAMCGVNDIKELEDNGQFKMVQFHPSYDYTDFVEGLRPTGTDNNGNIIFARQDGVFKTFCKNAINFTSELSFDSAYTRLIENIKKGNIKTISLKTKESTELDVRGDDSIGWYSETEKNHKSSNIVSRARLKQLFYVYNTLDKLDELQNINNGIQSIIGGCDSSYYWGVLHYLLENNTLQSKPHVLIIDEINRGDMSKIFGELFFAIDPGYRGDKGKIDTQYQNLVEENDEFKKGFYVPDNVYIIGTMNDIDRSVDSMDFAMRRRFQFIEVTAESRAENMFKDDNGNSLSNAKTAKEIMTNLNNCIISKEIGLSKSYQIGGSYFKKFAVNEENAQSLWDYRLKGLLREYLRGDEEEAINNKLEILYKAYKKENEYSEEGKLVTKANQSQLTEPELNAQ